MRRPALIAITLSILVTSPLTAQVVDGPHGPIEFIGLEHWTPRRVLDTLALLAPGKPLHACAAILKSQLHFADAGVSLYPDTAGRMYTVVSVVESQHGDRVRYHAESHQHLTVPPDWDSLAATLNDPSVAQAVALTYPIWAAGHTDSAFALGRMFGVDSAPLATSFAQVTRVAHSHDALLAKHILVSDSSSVRRKAAVLVVAQSPDQDSSWWALTEAQLDFNQQVGALAGQVLSILITQHPRAVDWAPIAPTLRDILNGSNLFALLPTIHLLVGTRVSSRLAPSLLGGAGNTVLAFAGATHQEEREAARQLLTTLSGHAPDTSPDDWRRWIASLPAH